MKPSINGFSLKSLKTFPTDDGYAIYCKLYRGSKCIGTYHHAGDGGEGQLDDFRAHIELNKELEKWKKDDPVDLGGGHIFIYDWDVDRLIEELITLEELHKHWSKSLKKGFKSIYQISDERHPTLLFACHHDDRNMISLLAGIEADKRGFSSNRKLEIYITEDDFKKEVPND